MISDNRILVILGPTATGKTRTAALVAHKMNGEIISADSRQVYRGMDIGTGKDLSEYRVNDDWIGYHLIDIVDPGYHYNVYEYQRDFVVALEEIRLKDKNPILCGGTGLYLEAVLKGYRLIHVPPDPQFRSTLEGMSMEELTDRLGKYKTLHNTTDVTSRKRLIRALEIERYYSEHMDEASDYPRLEPVLVGIAVDRQKRRERISERLKKRLDEGMVEEVQRLMAEGVDKKDLLYYGLEYRYIALYLTGELEYQEMVARLETSIHRYAKRQMTWFRGMERRGLMINWIPLEEGDLVEKIVALYHNL